MKNLRSISLWAILLLLGSFATSCVYHNRPPRRYDYGYRMPPPPPRVIVVHPGPPPPRVVYRDHPGNHGRRNGHYKQGRYDNGRRNYEYDERQLRSNRNYNQNRRYDESARRDRSRGPR
ncbi:hypothetical protein [Telluribacter humicola]|uniref:hypothetical protein n=1 Tax=Telluribacter humicola TaxID=1720261 RepID=UPI001A9691F9|nr:hypothetical protein [Telluribacter humicola]